MPFPAFLLSTKIFSNSVSRNIHIYFPLFLVYMFVFFPISLFLYFSLSPPLPPPSLSLSTSQESPCGFLLATLSFALSLSFFSLSLCLFALFLTLSFALSLLFLSVTVLIRSHSHWSSVSPYSCLSGYISYSNSSNGYVLVYHFQRKPFTLCFMGVCVYTYYNSYHVPGKTCRHPWRMRNINS